MEHDERAQDAHTQDGHAQDEQQSGDAAQGARTAAKGAARAQHTLYVLPHDWSLLRRVLSPVLERAERAATKRKADAAPAGPAVLVVTPDADATHAAAGTARALLDDAAAFLPVTAPGRAARLVRDGAPLGVSGTPTALLELVRASALKLDDVKSVVIAWGDDVLAAGAGADLEAILGEVPKGERIMVAGAMTEELEQLVERYMRRPRRADGVEEPAGERLPTTVHYLTVAAASRPAALRRLLDELDPASAAIVAPSEEAAADARLALATLGYRAEDAAVRVTGDVVPEGTELAVLYELPQDAATLRRASVASQVVALVQPRQLAALRRVSGGNVAAFTLSDARRAAQSREEALRDELRRLLATGQFTRELMALEPLLGEHDGIEIAAALLRLVDEGRRRRPAEARRAAAYLLPDLEPAIVPAMMPSAGAMPQMPAAPMAEPAATPAYAAQPAAPAYAQGAAPAWTRVFVNVGTRDGAGAGDILGALAGEAGVERTKIGRIEMRDSHSLAEVSTDVVERVVEAANGGMMRGRALVVRVDAGSDRPARPIGRNDRGDRSPRPGGDRFERGPRSGGGGGGARFDRGDRGDRPERGARFERSDRGDRPQRDDRGPRPGGFSRDRAAGGDRPQRDDRGDRGGAPRREGGFAPREGGYRPREGGFKPREGGFKPREGGFKPREGGFKPREGGFKPREGGFKPRGEGGFRGPREGGRDAGPRGGGGGREGGPRGGGGGGGGFRNPNDERNASFGRTLNDEQREWSDRADRVRNARRPRTDET